MNFINKTVALFVLAGTLMACQSETNNTKLHIIPEPVSLKKTDNPAFRFNDETKIFITDTSMFQAAKRLKNILSYDITIETKTAIAKDMTNRVLFKYHMETDSLGKEGYLLKSNQKNITVEATTPVGFFYGVETIRQLFPPASVNQSKLGLEIPSLQITDKPRFKWRGMHLDVSRHFMPVSFVKEFIDYLAMHKLNTFHWHLVDGIGWRIEIKSHPELTDIGAWRVVKEGKKPWEDFEVWRPGDDRKKYGGFYTQEEIKQVVAYAKERNITVIPEIELPGHSEVVFQCYPELLCVDKNNAPLANNGVYCAGNPNSYKLLEAIIDEVITLFPSEYIHIGGDEVSKRNWNTCIRCKKVMNSQNYDAFELQSHFVNHFDQYLKDKGRKLIGWHEILEGELSPTATIMYWGAENGVEKALSEGHPTVLTTGSHLYFDHYQSLSKNEPKAFGGFAPLKKVYQYEPLPDSLENKYKSKVLGIQANIWTEYMSTPEHIEYMAFPRIAALSEIAWQEKGKKDWKRFQEKMESQIMRYEKFPINFSRSAYRPIIESTLDKETKGILVSLITELPCEVIYTTDGSNPSLQNGNVYNQPIVLQNNTIIKAIALKNEMPISEIEEKEIIVHKALGAKTSLINQPFGKYSASGATSLTDGIFGGNKWGNGKWLGFLNKDLESTIQLDTTTTVQKIGLSCIEETAAGIYFPTSLEVSYSQNGKVFTSVQKLDLSRKNIEVNSEVKTRIFWVDFPAVETKYLKVTARYSKIQDKGTFIFTDEIIIK